MDCHMAIIDPILESTDPRLAPEYAPLPFELVALWQNGNAPIAPYLEDIAHRMRPATLLEWQTIFETLADMVKT
jgi:hypothetical protein